MTDYSATSRTSYTNILERRNPTRHYLFAKLVDIWGFSGIPKNKVLNGIQTLSWWNKISSLTSTKQSI